MGNIATRLEEWRCAERRRDALVEGSQAWQEAREAVERAATAFHAEVAQAAARYAEAEFEEHAQVWLSRWGVRAGARVE